MFFQPPDDSHFHKQNIKIARHNTKQKRKRKNKQKRKQQAFKKDLVKKTCLFTMSNWAQSFAVASTWQLKHQLAYWKARAKSLEYENSMLHEIIRKNCINTTPTESCDSDTELDGIDKEVEENLEQDEMPERDEGEDFEVSEEFIQFLTTNAKFKEEARLERERLRAKSQREDNIQLMEADPPEKPEDKQKTLQRLYGDRWQKISALEMALQSQFVNVCDQDEPVHWPNIPFNFNFS